jgi:four helix bundle protein
MEDRMEKSQNFTDLIVWQKAHEFVLEVYKITKEFPKDELYGLISQFRRAAVSIPANLAEGYGKTSKADKLRFFNISQGSLKECSYYLILVSDLNYIKNYEELNNLLNEVAKLLNAYIHVINNSIQ